MKGKSSNKKEKKEWQKKRKSMGNTIPTLGQKKNNKRPGSYHPAALGNYQETKSNNS